MPVEQYLKVILEPLLVNPKDLVITSSNDELGVLLSVSCNRSDMGMIIGKAGETAKALRQLVRIAGYRENSRVSIKINEPDGSSYAPRRAA